MRSKAEKSALPKPGRYLNPLRATLGPEFFKGLPREPGVYFMYDGGGRLLYIGKAKSLRIRLGSYARARPGSVPDHTIELIENIRQIRIQRCGSEREALATELELLRAARPPYNIAHTDGDPYLYIGVRLFGHRLAFALSSHPEIRGTAAAPYTFFGGFRDRRRTQEGYQALLRLLHAATSRSPRFSFPARICRSSPPYLYEAAFRPEWLPALGEFLSGRSPRLLALLCDELLAQESIPRFMHRGIQEDFASAAEFFQKGPKATRKLRLRHGKHGTLVARPELDELVMKDLAPALGTRLTY